MLTVEQFKHKRVLVGAALLLVVSAGVVLVAVDYRAAGAVAEVRFDPESVRLPGTVVWRDAHLDSQSVSWEEAWKWGDWRVRPVPGTEGPGRTLAVTGAFAGPRRIELDVIYRGHVGPENFGFGLFPLWTAGGGASDLVWYQSRLEAVGMEFARANDSGDPVWVSTYRNMDLEARVRYHIVVEVSQDRDADGRHLRYRQRLKWTREGAPEGDWMQLADDSGAPLPEAEYAIALLADRSEVDFGDVRITPIAAPSLPSVHAVQADGTPARRSVGQLADRVGDQRQHRSAETK